MSYEIIINQNSSEIELLERDGNHAKVRIDGREYEIDLVMVEPCVYSILNENMSHKVEIACRGGKNFLVNSFHKNYDIEVIDAATKYQRSRSEGEMAESSTKIISPMPGKIVKIPVKVGDSIKNGDTAIIVSAMKMESEFKAMIDGTIKEIKVKEGDTVDGDQLLILIEPAE